MTQSEYQSWKQFYRLYPFDDLHRYHRPAALISVSMGGGDYKQKVDFLQPEPIPDGYGDADWNTFKAFGVRPPMRGE